MDCIENKGKLIVISGPSGVGKSTLLHRLFRENAQESPAALNCPFYHFLSLYTEMGYLYYTIMVY